MRIEQDIKLDFCDVLIKPKRSTLSSRSEVGLERTFKFKHTHTTWTGIPLMAANMDTTGTFEMFQELHKHKIFTVLHKHYSKDQLVEFFNSIDDNQINYVFYSLGIREQDYEKFREVDAQTNGRIRFVCIDAPSAYIEKFVDSLRMFRKNHPHTVILAGNVCSGEMAEQLIISGADIVKAGLGSGAGCLTRRVAGVGVPQLSCVIECADAAHGVGGLVCSDGGIVNPGDLGKAFGANADFCMMGSVLAGHDESGGEFVLTKDIGFQFETHYRQIPRGTVAPEEILANRDVYKESLGKRFYGMSSYQAQEKYYGPIETYRASEGRETTVAYKGPVMNTLKEFLGGLRSTLTYVGARNLKELSKRTTFIMVNRQLNTSLE